MALDIIKDNRQPIVYFVTNEKTVFVPLKFVYPECFFHIKDKPSLYPIKCFLTDACPVGANCGEILVKRVHYLFNEVLPDAQLLIAYFKYRDRPNSIRGAVFNRDLDTPNVSILNPFAFRKFQREGTTYQWYPTDEYLFMGGSKGLIVLPTII
jgi:hypothetical protein